MDELVIRYRFKRRYRYLWLVVSRLTHQVLAWRVGDRSEKTLQKLWGSVALDYRRKLVYSDFYEAHKSFFRPWQHRSNAKGSGKTSVIEGLNNNRRLLFGFLTRRLRTLTQQMETFQQEGAAESAKTSTSSTRSPARQHEGDEIERMRSVFVQMSERILTQKAQRENIEAQRREAVTNVSHDLRTPIAALQGYLETLLIKEGKLSHEEQRDYLMTAMKHAERLGKLVAELFELSRLDSHEMQPAWEDFSLAELAQDVVQQFTLTARNKGIKIGTHFGSDLPFVRADIGLVERALENLIENALHYTPPDGAIALVIVI